MIELIVKIILCDSSYVLRLLFHKSFNGDFAISFSEGVWPVLPFTIVFFSSVRVHEEYIHYYRLLLYFDWHGKNPVMFSL